MDSRLQQDQRRCTLTYEHVYIESGHEGCHEPRIEYEVRIETAPRLIPLEVLCTHAAWAASVAELVDDLWVTTEVVTDRPKSFSHQETAQVYLVEHQTR